MKICIENSNGYADFQRLALDRLLESPVFALTFDISHNHGTGHVDESTLLNHRDKLHHFHSFMMRQAEKTIWRLAQGKSTCRNIFTSPVNMAVE